MKVSEKYAQATAKGCQQTLNVLIGLDDNITVAEIRTFLEYRIKKANNKIKEDSVKLIEALKGKCFRIVFNAAHLVLLKVQGVIIIEEYGEVDAVMVGEEIVKYKDDVSHEYLTEKSGKKYSNFFSPGNKEQIEIDVVEFDKISAMYKQMYNSLIKF